ncbi:MAG: dihydrolipoamide acetyltransferase family protein [Pseudomonadota bacterium]
MPIEVIMPRVDMTMETGTILAWKVREGDDIHEGSPLFEITTDKATMEVEATASGRLGRILVEAGVEVPVGTVVAQILGPGEQLVAPAERTTEPVAIQHDARTSNGALPPGIEASAPTAPSPAAEAHKVRATPLARRLARLHGIDLAVAQGSGPRGRIVGADIDRWLAARAEGVHVPAPESRAPATPSRGKLLPFGPTRRLIAQRMTKSVQTAPHFYMSAVLDMSAVLELKERVSERLVRTAGAKASVTAILIRLLGLLLGDHPYLNASVESDAARLHEGSHIGVAMDRDGDLLVPVIRDAETLSLAGIVRELERLRTAAARRTILPADLRGSTFTLSNLGMYGVDSFTAIINPPESGILAVGRIVDTPVGCGGEVVLRPSSTFTLSADHRLVDGVTAARFMRDLRALVENPTTAL